MKRMSDKNIIEKAADVVENITKARKASKLKTAYIERDEFKDSDLHKGYFCYNCTFWLDTMGGRCMIVKEKGPDVFGKVSDVIAPHGWCNAYEPNQDKIK
jgi:High potential iron-sulfur protein